MYASPLDLSQKTLTRGVQSLALDEEALGFYLGWRYAPSGKLTIEGSPEHIIAVKEWCAEGEDLTYLVDELAPMVNDDVDDDLSLSSQQVSSAAASTRLTTKRTQREQCRQAADGKRHGNPSRLDEPEQKMA